jgi:hypothetical protein
MLSQHETQTAKRVIGISCLITKILIGLRFETRLRTTATYR